MPMLEEFVATHYPGGLTAGYHSPNPDGEACVLEAVSQWLDLDWTDDPATLRMFDLRPLNDIDVSAEVRTPAMCRLAELYAGSLDWPVERQQAVVQRIVIGTVREIIAELPGLPEEAAAQCRSARTLDEARAAALAVAVRARAVELAVDAALATSAAEDAARAARAAALAATVALAAALAATVALAATAARVFRSAYRIWKEAAAAGWMDGVEQS